MNLFFPLLISTIAGLSTTLGALLIYLKITPQNINKFITLVLSFSLAIMIGISITDLIPTSLFPLLKLKNGLLYSSIAFISGILLIKYLIRKINKVEKNQNNLYQLGILNMIVLMLHNFPEGIATFLSSYQDLHLGLKLSFAIMLHNIPEGISIAVPLYYATHSKFKAIKAAFISGLSEPFGALLAFLLLKNFITNELISIILLFVSSIMITLSIEKIYPEALKYKENKFIIIGLVLGTLLILLNHFFL
ncbi:MAG: ZIP family metal transporter [Bacilli bacterium]|nr:ZIP family metal transporter [Bacilli bacterium]